MDLLIAARRTSRLVTARRTGGLMLCLALARCDAIVDASYRGDPVFSFEGQLVQFEGIADEGHELRTTLLWLTDLSTDPATQGPRLERAVEQRSAAVEVRFPSEFRIDLFAPPDASMLLPGTGLGVALVVVYEDRDGNDRLTLGSRPSELVGGAPYEALVFAEDAASAAGAPFEEAVRPGFQLVRIPLFCGAATIDACTTPLGAPCADDAACGAEGVCLKESDGVTWPGGACVLRDVTVTCLPPEDAGFYVALDGASWIIDGCADPEDCRDGYRCDDLFQGCVPDEAATTDLPFAPRLPRRTDLPACAIELGAPCVVDGDCAEGVCLVRSNGESFSGGYCALPIDEIGAPPCQPDGGVALAWDYRPDGRETHWFRGCESDAECRVDGGYACDPWLAACLPVSPVALELASDFAPSAFCYGGTQ